jgi:hypothetical protein
MQRPAAADYDYVDAKGHRHWDHTVLMPRKNKGQKQRLDRMPLIGRGLHQAY